MTEGFLIDPKPSNLHSMQRERSHKSAIKFNISLGTTFLVQTKKIKAAFFSSNLFGGRLFCFVLLSSWIHQQDEKERREGGEG